RHHEVMQREPHDEHVEDPDGPPHTGPTATSVRPRLSTRTGYGKSAANSFGPRGSRTSSNPRARNSRRRAASGGSQWANGSSEPLELGAADGGDPFRPGVERLEEVVGRAAAERRVGDADVHDRRLRPRPVELEEETKLPFPAPQRDARSGLTQHRRSVTAGAELSRAAPPLPW